MDQTQAVSYIDNARQLVDQGKYEESLTYYEACFQIINKYTVLVLTL